MNRLHFSIDIDAPREAVWNVLWNDATFRDWTSVFAEGSYAVSDWKEGSTIQFLDPNSGSGMSAVIETKRPHEFMSFRHVAEIHSGQERRLPGYGALENYTLEDNGGSTTLIVELDTFEAYQQMFEEKFPQALHRVKTLSEQARLTPQ